MNVCNKDCCEGRGCGNCSYCYGECYVCNNKSMYYECNPAGYALIIHDTEGSSEILCFESYSKALGRLKSWVMVEDGVTADEIIDNEYQIYPYKYILTMIRYDMSD